MFTGIIEAVGRVASLDAAAGLRRLRLETGPKILEGLDPGASLAVDGACLTAVDVAPEGISVEAVASTLSRTILGGYREGTLVNLERAMSASGRFDGHLVQGHIDGIGHLTSIREEGGTKFLTFSVPAEVHRTTLLHGSITVNGVSLTVNRLAPDREIEVAVIPHTWSHTNFHALGVGEPVNVEGDLIGKYVGKLLGEATGKGRPESSSSREPRSP